MKKTTALIIGLLVAATACEDVAGPPTTGIVLSGSAGVTDTIGAVLPQPILFRVFDAEGEPMAGAQVSLIDVRGEIAVPGFRVFPTAGRLYVTLEDAQSGDTTDSESVTTDASGQASVYLRLGEAIGDVHVKAVSGENRDSVQFHALPGNAVGLGALPSDTAIAEGASYELTVFAVDRAGNPRPGVESGVTLTSSSPDVETNGALVAGVSTGRAAIELASTTGTGTVHVSVVPLAMFAVTPDVYAPAPGDAPAILRAHGGAGDPVGGLADGACPAWHPDGDRLLFDGLRVVTTAGQHTQIPTGHDDLIPGCGTFSSDGEWIYFDGRPAAEANASQVWRIRTDGTGLEQITSAPEVIRAAGASPSPDGTRIAYVVPLANDMEGLVVHTLATGVADTIVDPGFRLRASWSPTGEWIAYTYNTSSGLSYPIGAKQWAFADRVALVRPDGTDAHSLPDEGVAADHNVRGSVSWSPGGEWIAAKAFFVNSEGPDSRIKLMNITTGETLPLNATTRAYAEPAWRPQPE